MNSTASMTRLVSNKSLDIQIHHEYKKFGEAPTTPIDGLSAARKNPILQQTDENVQEFKPVCKRIPGAGEATMFTATDKPRNTKAGEFHPKNKEPKEEKVQSIKTIRLSPSKCHSEVKKRELKPVQNARPAFNPITEGDPSSVKEIKVRKFDQEVSEHYVKHNEKKYFLPAARKETQPNLQNMQSPTKLRVNMDENAHITLSSAASSTLSNANEKPHPMVQKHRGTISEVLQYQHGPSFKDNGVSDKINQIPVKVVNENLNTEKHFARKRPQYD